MDQSDKAYLPYKSDCHDIAEKITESDDGQQFKYTTHRGGRVFNATFNNISAISWWSVLLVEESGVPGENHRPVTNH